MPTIEIMSPMSETCVEPKFNVEGEHDLTRIIKGKTWVKCFTRRSGSGDAYAFHNKVEPASDGTWSCPMDLTAGHNYDIKAGLYDEDTPMADSPPDEVVNILVSVAPPIIIIPPPPPGGLYKLPADRLLEGKTPRHDAATDKDRIVCYIFRRSRKLKLFLPVAFYAETVWPSDGNWWLKVGDMRELFRPQPGDPEKPKMFTLLAAIVDDKKKVKRTQAASIVLRKKD